MYDDLNKKNGKRVILSLSLLLFAVAMLAIIFFDLFGFIDFISDRDFTPEKIRLYGGIFFVVIGISGVIGLLRALTDTPMKSLEQYARKTEHPEVTLEQLKKSWKNGYEIRTWCHMDDTYLITFINGVYANIVPIKDVAWAYKTVTRMNFIKTNTTLFTHYANQTCSSISVGEGVIDSILQKIAAEHRDIAVGHSSDAEKLYRSKDMAGLKEYAHQQRAGVHGSQA